MWKCILVCSSLLCGVGVLCMFSKIISKGRWAIDAVEQCPDHESYPYDLYLQKKKVNRTHDGYNGAINLLEDFTEDDFGISGKNEDGKMFLSTTQQEEGIESFLTHFRNIYEEINIVLCKKVDGGCRTVNTMDEKSLCRLFVKYAEENWKKALKNMGAEEQCPILKGYYELKDYIFDNTELPDDGMVGEFKATFVVMKHDIHKMACFVLHLHFNEDED